jgi:hypothetical protein
MPVTRRLPRRLAAAMLLAVPLACGDDDPAGPAELTLADLAGDWITTRFEFVEAGNGTSIEIIGLAATLTFQVGANGDFTADFDPGGLLSAFAPEITGGTISGTIIVGTGTLTISPDFDPDIPLLTSSVLTFQVHWGGGSTVTLTGAETVFDFDRDGEDEPASLTLVIQRA